MVNSWIHCSPGGLTLLYYTTVTSWTSGYISGAEKFSELHNSNLTRKKAPISTDSHSMAAYVFLQWVLIVSYSAQIRHFHEIMQLPTFRNSHFCLYSHSLPCVRKTRKSWIVMRVNAVQSRYGDQEFMRLSLHHAFCTPMYTRTHDNRQHWENDH